VFTKSTRLNAFLSIVLIAAFSACGDTGGCGCTAAPLPGGALPADQTVEGGGQIRVTQAGFQKLTSIIPGFLNSQFANGFCIGQGEIGDSGFTGADYCYTNQGGTAQIPDSCGGGNGCNVGIHMDFVDLSVTNAQLLNMHIQLDVHAIVPLDGAVVWIPWSCNMNLDGNNLVVDADIAFDIDPATGELGMHLEQINSFDSSDLSFSNCGLISGALDIVNDVLNSFVGQFVIDLLTPTLDGLVQGFLPDPLGIEGLIDVGTLVGGVSPGTEGSLEARMVPGGYVQLGGGGMSLGLITGLNADEDTSTRTADLDSEPAFCVPPIPAPNFAAPPASLPATARGTFTLAPANEFIGNPEPADDLAIGISETTLDLAGHHLVTSGGMCLGVGTSLIAQLNLGVFSLLVPSLSTLGDATNPVLLVTRPQTALDFTVGDGTEESPAISIGINAFEVDMYVFAYERYTRAFTMRLDLTVGVNLVFDQQPGMPATVTPELVGLDADNIEVAVLNNEFVSESQADLEGVLPTIFDLAVGLLGDGLGAIEVPSFAGFTLNDMRVQHVSTSEDDFLAIYASLGSSAALQQMADQWPAMRPALDDMDAMVQEHGAPQGQPTYRLLSVDTPAPEVVRAALHGDASGRIPAVTLELPTHNAQGQPLEYAWNLGGIWRPFRTPEGGTLTIQDRAFAWQGKYTIQLRSRVVDDYHTTSQVTEIPVIIDSVGPRILADRMQLDGDGLLVPADDLVSGPAGLRWAWAHPGDEDPATDWSTSATIDRTALDGLAVDGAITVFVQDETGNVSSEIIAFHGQAGEGGCACDSSGGNVPTTGGVLMLLMTAGLLFRRRVASIVRGRSLRRFHPGIVSRRTARVAKTLGLWIVLCSVSAFTPACNCGGDPGVQACEVTEDCTIECPAGQIPFCLDHTCVCTSDVPYGRIGPYSDVAVDSEGDAWVSSYAESHGDLVVAEWDVDGRIQNEAWEWVDGVPDGPVAIPDSDIRGGILAPGPNVGMYTSVAVGPGDVPMVTYFDVDTGSLKFAAKRGNEWEIHVIDDGTGTIDPELGGEMAGMYSAITLRTDDGRPGVAYLAQVSEGSGVVRAEVRFAAAQTPNPSSPDDWVPFVVDTVVLPPLDPNMPDPTPLPGGIGLFLDATRDAAQAPIIAYYDRLNGDLKLGKLDVTSGTFTTQILDGDQGTDVGLYPSVAVDAAGTVYVSYESATRDDLLFVDTATNAPEIVDDGYRIVGQTEDGLPKPEFHFVGDDSNVVILPTGPVIIYQDATTHELLYTGKTSSGVWVREAIAGDEPEFVGAYGFFAAVDLSDQDVVISNWVIDQPHSDNWVEIFRERIIIE
jgi:hypothetical protein